MPLIFSSWIAVDWVFFPVGHVRILEVLYFSFLVPLFPIVVVVLIVSVAVIVGVGRLSGCSMLGSYSLLFLFWSSSGLAVSFIQFICSVSSNWNCALVFDFISAVFQIFQVIKLCLHLSLVWNNYVVSYCDLRVYYPICLNLFCPLKYINYEVRIWTSEVRCYGYLSAYQQIHPCRKHSPLYTLFGARPKGSYRWGYIASIQSVSSSCIPWPSHDWTLEGSWHGLSCSFLGILLGADPDQQCG